MPRHQARAEAADDWPKLEPIQSELPSVQAFSEDLLPDSFRPLVADVADRMQVPMDYPAVVMVLPSTHFIMLKRNLFYTALTRGKKKVFLVGEPAAYMMAVRNSESRHRCTHLCEKILKMISGGG